MTDQSPSEVPSATSSTPGGDRSQQVQPAAGGRSSGTGLIITGIAVMVVGLLTAVGAVIGLLSSGSGLVDAFRADPIQVPGEAQLSLTPATYTVLQLSDGQSYKIEVNEIRVSGPAGTVQVTDPGVAESLDRNGKVYEGVAQFRISDAGTYTITVASQGPGEIIVGQSIGSTLTRSAVWVALLGLAGFLGLVGLGLLIFGIVRRSIRATPTPDRSFAVTGPPEAQVPPVAPAMPVVAVQPAPSVQPPAAWYPDPDRPGGQRYWDGAAWTEYRA